MKELINNLDRDGLAQLGIAFETEDESQAFESLIREEFEVRVGEGIADRLSPEELCVFDSLPASDAKVWLQEHCPDQDSIIAAVSLSLKRELLQYRDQIGGCCRTRKLKESGAAISELDISSETKRSLERLGILTFGELSSIGDQDRTDMLRLKVRIEAEQLLENVKEHGIDYVLKK